MRSAIDFRRNKASWACGTEQISRLLFSVHCFYAAFAGTGAGADSPAIEQRIQDLLAKLTLEQKIILLVARMDVHPCRVNCGTAKAKDDDGPMAGTWAIDSLCERYSAAASWTLSLPSVWVVDWS